jgi:hypothetical protein
MLNVVAAFTTLHFLRNLPIGQMRFGITLHQVGKACQGQTL